MERMALDARQMPSRTPRHYNGQRTTTHHLKYMMPSVLQKVTSTFKDRPDLIVLAWKEVIGPHFAPMTEAISFENGALNVKVKNSSIHALLSRSERPKLIAALRAKFPQVEIKTILFRIG